MWVELGNRLINLTYISKVEFFDNGHKCVIKAYENGDFRCQKPTFATYFEYEEYSEIKEIIYKHLGIAAEKPKKRATAKTIAKRIAENTGNLL